MLPDIFSAQAYTNFVASNYLKYTSGFNSQDPSTPVFLLNQLQNFLATGQVQTGVEDPNPNAFSISFDNANQLFNVSQGNFSYANNSYVVPPQNFKFAPLFKGFYSNLQYFIASIYLNVNSLQNNSITQLTISQPLLSSSICYIKEINVLAQLSVPFNLQILNQLFQVNSYDLSTGKLYLTNTTSFPSAIPAGTICYALSEPNLSCVYTQPFSDNSSQVFIANHINSAITPSYGFKLYDILMQNPNSPSLVISNGQSQIRTNFINYSTADSSQYASGSNLISAINSFNLQVQQIDKILNIQSLVSQFFTATQMLDSTTSVSNYWLNTPLLQPEISSAGIDLGRYKKFDFSNLFLEANYKYGSGKLYELLYSFDPINYNTINSLSGNYAPTNVSATILPSYGPNSAPVPSVVTYGVTAVANTNYPSGETPATYVTSAATSALTNVGEEIKFDPSNSSSFIYNNVYRKSVANSLSVDFLLTQPGELNGDTNFGSNLPQSPLNNSQNFTGPFAPFQILNVNGTGSKFALEFIPRLSTGSVAQYVFIGGSSISLSSSGSYSGQASIQCQLINPTPSFTGPTVLGQSDLMPLSKITNSPTNYSFKLNQSFTGSLNLTPGNPYYFIYSIQNKDVISNPIFGQSTTASGSTLAKQYTTSWTDVPNLAFQFNTLGFVDDLKNNSVIVNPQLPRSSYVYRGVREIRNKLTRPRNIYAFVPYFIVDKKGHNISTQTSNDLLVTVTGFNSLTGVTTTFSNISIPKSSKSGTKIQINNNQNSIDQILSISISPGVNLNLDNNNQIIWGTYDYLLIIGDD